MDGICALVAETCKTHGYRVTPDAALEGQSGAVYAAPLLLEGEGFAAIVERRGADEPVTPEMLAELDRVVEDIGADRAILAHLGPVEAKEAKHVVLWGPDVLQELIGNAALMPLGVPPATLPLAPTPPGTPVENLAPESLALPDAFASEPIDLHQLDSLATGELETLAAYPVAPMAIEGLVAEQKTRSQLYGIDRREMVLQPMHVIAYECDLLIEGSLHYETVTGLLGVDAAKQIAEIAEAFHPKHAGDIPAGLTEVEERDMKLEPPRAQELAHAHVMDANTRMVDVETWDEESDVSMTERKRVTPRPDQVRIQHLGVVHRPFWRVFGPNGSCLMDAVTGDVEYTLRNYDPDVVMLD